MTGISMIRKPPQDELKAIYESISSAEGKKPSLTKEPIEIQASTVNSAARKKGKLTVRAQQPAGKTLDKGGRGRTRGSAALALAINSNLATW